MGETPQPLVNATNAVVDPHYSLITNILQAISMINDFSYNNQAMLFDITEEAQKDIAVLL